MREASSTNVTLKYLLSELIGKRHGNEEALFDFSDRSKI